MTSPVVVVVAEVADGVFECAGQVVLLEQDPVLQGLMPFDLASQRSTQSVAPISRATDQVSHAAKLE